jgi:ABC-type uncharacterized transport system involved in gliding motility auxiliary subunit
MKLNWRPIIRWGSIVISIAALIAAAVLYLLQHEWNLYLQISLGLFIIGLAVYVVQDPDSIRRAVTGRQARYGSNAFIITIAFLGILVVVNYFVYKNDKTWDLTTDKSNTLAKETQDVLKNLTGTVDAKAFFTSDPNLDATKANAKNLLDMYVNDGSGKFQYEFIDPNENPTATKDAGITQDGSIVLYMGNTKQPASAVSEAGITGAMVRLLNPDAYVIYFLTGHGEDPIEGGSGQSYTQLATALEAKNYKVATLNLITNNQIPQDAKVIVIAGPKKPLTDAEVSLLDTYIKNGGSIVVMEDPTIATQFGTSPDPLAIDLAQTYGIVLGNDVVVDEYGKQVFNSPYDAIGYQYATHAITDKMATLGTSFQTARSVTANNSVGTDYTKTALVYTVDQSWGETDIASIQNNNPVFDQGVDLKGPVPLAVAATGTTNKARLVVFGDSDFATNTNYGFYGNSDLIVNSIDWAANLENLINLSSDVAVTRTLATPTPLMMNLLLLGSFVVLPGLVIIAGISSWVARRRKG